MRHLFLINPAAGKHDRSGEIIPLVEELMAHRGEPYEIKRTEYPLHAAALTRDFALEGGQCRVYACGGDGTLNEAASGAAGLSNVAITHYPCGTGNDYIRLFGQDAARFRDLRELIEGEVLTADTIDCAGRTCMNICSVGLDARISNAVGRFKKLPAVRGKGAYNLSLVYNLLHKLHRYYKVRLDGKEMDGRYTMLVACNGRYYGGGFNPVPEAMPDDGIIDFLLVGPVSQLTVARVVSKYQNGQYAQLPQYITHLRGREMEVVCAGLEPVNVDGEIVSGKAFSFTLSDKKLNFVVPRGAHWDDAHQKTENGIIGRKWKHAAQNGR